MVIHLQQAPRQPGVPSGMAGEIRSIALFLLFRIGRNGPAGLAKVFDLTKFGGRECHLCPT